MGLSCLDSLCNIMSNMTNRVTVRQVQHELARILAKVQKGQELLVTKRGKVVAKLVPAGAQEIPLRWPDAGSRLARRFPDGVPAGQPASEIIDNMRGERG